MSNTHTTDRPRGTYVTGFRALCLGAATTAALLGAALPASAAPDPVAACEDGKHVNYRDPATGMPFANQGRCVSTLARGGELVPMVPPVKVLFSDRIYTDPVIGEYVDGFRAEISGQPGIYPVTVTINGKTVVVENYEIFTADEPRHIGKWVLENGMHEVVVTVEDQTFTKTYTISKPPPEPQPAMTVGTDGSSALVLSATNLNTDVQYHYGIYVWSRMAAPIYLPADPSVPTRYEFNCNDGATRPAQIYLVKREGNGSTVYTQTTDPGAAVCAPVAAPTFTVTPAPNGDLNAVQWQLSGMLPNELEKMYPQFADSSWGAETAFTVDSNGTARGTYVFSTEGCHLFPVTFVFDRMNSSQYRSAPFTPARCAS